MLAKVNPIKAQHVIETHTGIVTNTRIEYNNIAQETRMIVLEYSLKFPVGLILCSVKYASIFCLNASKNGLVLLLNVILAIIDHKNKHKALNQAYDIWFL